MRPARPSAVHPPRPAAGPLGRAPARLRPAGPGAPRPAQDGAEVDRAARPPLGGAELGSGWRARTPPRRRTAGGAPGTERSHAASKGAPADVQTMCSWGRRQGCKKTFTSIGCNNMHIGQQHHCYVNINL